MQKSAAKYQRIFYIENALTGVQPLSERFRLSHPPRNIRLG